jgi:hypothetical protein
MLKPRLLDLYDIGLALLLVFGILFLSGRQGMGFVPEFLGGVLIMAFVGFLGRRPRD